MPPAAPRARSGTKKIAVRSSRYGVPRRKCWATEPAAAKGARRPRRARSAPSGERGGQDSDEREEEETRGRGDDDRVHERPAAGALLRDLHERADRVGEEALRAARVELAGAFQRQIRGPRIAATRSGATARKGAHRRRTRRFRTATTPSSASTGRRTPGFAKTARNPLRPPRGDLGAPNPGLPRRGRRPGAPPKGTRGRGVSRESEKELEEKRVCREEQESAGACGAREAAEEDDSAGEEDAECEDVRKPESPLRRPKASEATRARSEFRTWLFTGSTVSTETIVENG